MIISFTNVIGAIRSLGEAAAQVITTNLKMWLGFETSETLGREEVDNGDFATPQSDWTFANGWGLSNNTAIYNGTGAQYAKLVQPLTTVAGRTYQVTFTLNELSGSNVKIGLATSANAFLTGATNFTALGTHTITMTATASDNRIVLQVNSATMTCTISNVSVKKLTQITPDKSGNNNVGELFTGKALEFDGTEDYLDVSGFSMSGNNATFAFWAYIRDNARADYFFDFHSSTTRFVFGFGQASQKLAVYSGGWQDFGDPPQDQWVRIVLTINGTTAKCFVDGVQLGTDKTISTYDFSSPTTIHIGARYTPETIPKWYDGVLSDFQVYNSVWSTDDIAYDYANPQNLVTDRDNTTIALSNLKAYWAMSEGAGSLTYDSSGEGNNGTIYGATYVDAQPRIPQLGMMNWSKGSNLLTYSEDFSQSVWTKNNLTQTYGFTSPTGLLNATKLIRTSTNSYIDSTINITTVQYNTASIYVKGVSNTIGEDVRLYVYNGTSVSSEAFTLTGDWQRITHTNSSAPGQSYMKIKLDIPNVTNGEVLVWAAQLEQSSSASAYRLTDGGATSNSTVIPNPTIPTQDIFGNAVRDRLNSFNLDGSGYAVNETLPTISDNISLSVWVKLDTFKSGNLGQIVGKRFAGSSKWFRIYRPLAGALRLEVASGVFKGFFCAENEWVHIAATIDENNLSKVYINGVFNTQGTLTGGFSFLNTHPLGIGARLSPALEPNTILNGLVSDVLIYDRVLTSDEVQNNYNAGLSAHRN